MFKSIKKLFERDMLEQREAYDNWLLEQERLASHINTEYHGEENERQESKSPSQES